MIVPTTIPVPIIVFRSKQHILTGVFAVMQHRPAVLQLLVIPVHHQALALGADGVVIARPFVTAVYGGGEEGIAAYVAKLKAELCDVMSMCGAKNISEIDSSMLFK